MTDRFMRAAALGLALLAFARTPLAAQAVYSSGAPNGGVGWNIFDDNQAAALFSTTSTLAFDDIRFWGILPDGPLYTPTMYWSIYADDAGAPGAAVATGSALTTAVLRASVGAGFSSWQFDFDVGDQSLASGMYWLALHDGPLDPTIVTGSTLFWETVNSGQYAIQTFSIDDSWNVINPDLESGDGLAFELRETPSVVGTPEPSSIALLATGVVGLIAVKRRVRKNG
jgi:hypothetical protein